MLERKRWSARFFPTDGLSMTVGMPRDVRSVLFPIPDSCKICGVPTEPADSMTSRVAATVKMELAGTLSARSVSIIYEFNIHDTHEVGY